MRYRHTEAGSLFGLVDDDELTVHRFHLAVCDGDAVIGAAQAAATPSGASRQNPIIYSIHSRDRCSTGKRVGNARKHGRRTGPEGHAIFRQKSRFIGARPSNAGGLNSLEWPSSSFVRTSSSRLWAHFLCSIIRAAVVASYAVGQHKKPNKRRL